MVRLNSESYLSHVDHIKGVVRKLGTSLDVVDDKLNIVGLVLEPIPTANYALLQIKRLLIIRATH
jgi:hypothetical protein